MSARTTYRNDRDYGFCPGCSHRLILDALDRVLVRLQWDPADVVIVSDIGCVGLSDQYFVTSGFHGLHGRSLTYATGIKLSRPDLHVINLIGDGGCGIGSAHLVSAARRNIGVATLVFNNLNFGMTGGEHSVTTPPHQKTVTTPWGNTELPLDIAQTVAVNGASYVWRGTVFDEDLDHQIEAALTHEGFALLDIWELCVAYYASANKVTPQALEATIDRLGFTKGLIRHTDRSEGGAALRAVWASWREETPESPPQTLEARFAPRLDHEFGVLVVGAAGRHIRTAGRLVSTAATLSSLWVIQRDDYPVTVRSGHSISEVRLAPTPLQYAGITSADALFILGKEGYQKVKQDLGQIAKDAWVFAVPDLAQQVADQLRDSPMAREASLPRLRVLRLDQLKGIGRASLALAAVAAGLGYLHVLDPEAIVEAAGLLSASYAQANQEAVRLALGSIEDVIAPFA